MKLIKLWIVTIMILIMVMSVPMTSTSFAAVKDYATLQWDIKLDSYDYPYEEGTIRITLTGVVGKQVDKYHVNSAVLPTYYYLGPFVGGPDFSPNDFYIDPNAPITGYKVNADHKFSGGLYMIAPKDKLAETIIELGEITNATKVTDLKLIPIVEGATMTVQLIDCEYFAFYQFHYAAFPGTNPLLLTAVDYGGVATHYFQMWAKNNPVVSRTFKRITDEDGSFRIYPFPDEYNTQETPIAFYVVTEAEAKALMANPNNLPTEMRPISITATPTASKVLVNEKAVSFEAYNIKGNNYFKLRDLAKVVSGTDKQFAVGFDNGTSAITLTSGNPYTIVGGELSNGAGKAKPALPTTSKIYVNGNETQFTAYNIGGNNYFKLRDVAKAFNIGVGYDNASKVITIDTKVNYPSPPVRYEAESHSSLNGNAKVAAHADASGGKAVIDIYQNGDSLTFNNCPAAKAITVRFAKGSQGDGVLSLYINGSHAKNVAFPNTGAWDKYQELDIEIDIPKGADVMFVQDAGDLSTNIDCVDFYENGLGS